MSSIASRASPRSLAEIAGGRLDREHAVAALLLLAAVAAIATSFWPGVMSADALAQFDMLDAGEYTNQFCPLLLALWKPLWDAGAGPGWILTAQLLGVAVGAYLVLRAALRPMLASAGSAVVMLSPPVFGIMPWLLRDVWFVAFLLLAFGLTVRAAQSERRARIVSLLLAAVAVWCLMAARQNAAPAALVAAIAIAAVWRPTPSAAGRWRSLQPVALGLVLVLAFGASQAAANRVIGVRDIDPDSLLYLYDLAGASVRDNEALVPQVVLPGGLPMIEEYWSPITPLSYSASPQHPLQYYMTEQQRDALEREWPRMVSGRPLSYLAHRGDVFLAQISVTQPAIDVFHRAQIDANERGYEIRFDAANGIARDYIDLFADVQTTRGGLLHRVFIYLLIGIATAAYLLRRSRSPAQRLVGLLVLGTLLYAGGLFVAAPAVKYRWALPAVIAAIIGAMVAGASLIADHRARSAS